MHSENPKVLFNFIKIFEKLTHIYFYFELFLL